MSKKVYGGYFVLNGKSVRGIMAGTQKQSLAFSDALWVTSENTGVKQAMRMSYG